MNAETLLRFNIYNVNNSKNLIKNFNASRPITIHANKIWKPSADEFLFVFAFDEYLIRHVNETTQFWWEFSHTIRIVHQHLSSLTSEKQKAIKFWWRRMPKKCHKNEIKNYFSRMRIWMCEMWAVWVLETFKY